MCAPPVEQDAGGAAGRTDLRQDRGEEVPGVLTEGSGVPARNEVTPTSGSSIAAAGRTQAGPERCARAGRLREAAAAVYTPALSTMRWDPGPRGRGRSRRRQQGQAVAIGVHGGRVRLGERLPGLPRANSRPVSPMRSTQPMPCSRRPRPAQDHRFGAAS